MFGVTHCTYWRCVVALSNHQEEADRSPLHACPVCLRKLHSSVRFAPAERDDALAAAFGALGIDDGAAWSAARATWIRTSVLGQGATFGWRPAATGAIVERPLENAVRSHKRWRATASPS